MGGVYPKIPNLYHHVPSTDTAPPTTMLHTHPLCVAERSSNMKMWFEIFLYRVRAVPGGHWEDFADRERDSRTGWFPVKPGGLTPMQAGRQFVTFLRWSLV